MFWRRMSMRWSGTRVERMQGTPSTSEMSVMYCITCRWAYYTKASWQSSAMEWSSSRSNYWKKSTRSPRKRCSVSASLIAPMWCFPTIVRWRSCTRSEPNDPSGPRCAGLDRRTRPSTVESASVWGTSWNPVSSKTCFRNDWPSIPRCWESLGKESMKRFEFALN